MRGAGEEPRIDHAEDCRRSTNSQPDSEHDDQCECDITGEDPSSVVEDAPHVVDPGERPRLTMTLPGPFDATQRDPGLPSRLGYRQAATLIRFFQQLQVRSDFATEARVLG